MHDALGQHKMLRLKEIQQLKRFLYLQPTRN